MQRNATFLAFFGLPLLLTFAAFAQEPRIGYIYPAGGRQGTEFDITVGGSRLDGVNNARISGTGVRVAVVQLIKPVNQGQAALLRQKLIELEEKHYAATGVPPTIGPASTQPATKPNPAVTWTIADGFALVEIKRKLAMTGSAVKRNSTPAIAETVILRVTIDPEAPVGQRELRLRTPGGLTNPLVFQVGQLPELLHPESAAGKRSESAITVPAVVNGQILPGDVHRYRFKAAKNEKLVIATSARELIPYLPDAVPGWFQATLALFDSKGNELGYADAFRFHPDPVLYYKIPADGEYVVEIRDSLYRGREDFVYRIEIGKLPYITSVFPLGGKLGAAVEADLRGWNLPRLSVTPDMSATGLRWLGVAVEDHRSNRMPFMVDPIPDCMEQEPNDTAETAQKVSLPIIINGRIDHPGDLDVFRFDGHAGEEIVAEVMARRLNSPLDSVLRLTDAAGKQLAFNDDFEDKGDGLTTHHADSYIRYKLPADGVYFVHLGDAQKKGGLEYAYRLRISDARPDFALRVAPSSINIRAGSTIAGAVSALRHDGFAGEIALALKEAPEGFILGGAVVPAGQDTVRITLTAPSTPTKDPVNISFEGRATIGGVEMVRTAVPAEDMMQAFAYRHLVPTKEMKLLILPGGGPRTAAKIAGAVPVKITAGGKGRVQVQALNTPANGELTCDLVDPPDGISVESVTTGDTTEIVLQCDAAKIKPGLKGNLIANVVALVPVENGPDKGNKRRVPMGMLPAIPFEVVGQ